MLYQTDLTIPANTLQSAQVETTIQLTKGVVNRVLIGFPPGCVGLAHVQVYWRNHQVWPSIDGFSFAWDNFIFDWSDDFPLDEPPYELRLIGWNLDTANAHTISFWFGMLSSAGSLAEYLKQVFGGLAR